MAEAMRKGNPYKTSLNLSPDESRVVHPEKE